MAQCSLSKKASSDERRAAVSAHFVRQMLDSAFLPSETQCLCGFEPQLSNSGSAGSPVRSGTSHFPAAGQQHLTISIRINTRTKGRYPYETVRNCQC